MANARSLSLESRLVAPADGTLNFAGVYAGGSLQQVMHTSVPELELQYSVRHNAKTPYRKFETNIPRKGNGINKWDFIAVQVRLKLD